MQRPRFLLAHLSLVWEVTHYRHRCAAFPGQQLLWEMCGELFRFESIAQSALSTEQCIHTDSWSLIVTCLQSYPKISFLDFAGMENTEVIAFPLSHLVWILCS